MKLVYLEKPFPHFLIESFYTDEELIPVYHELISLSKVLQPPEKTSSANDLDGTSRKHNLGVFVSTAYKISEASSIFNARKKLFNPTTMQEIAEANPVFSFFPYTNFDDTLIQFYKNGDYYKPHRDITLYSFITVFSIGQKKYLGGKLRFPKFDYEVDLQHNHSILFPSYTVHEVTEVSIDSDNLLDNRISITTLIGMIEKI